jgi:tetratricopeptide (TPR) repeat protein
MMQASPIDSDQFIRIVRPGLEQRDADGLARLVKEHWTEDQLCELLTNGTVDARKVVCLTLGLVGCTGCCNCLCAALCDEDPVIRELAEHALWSIWFRCGSPEALGQFKRGLELMDQNEYRRALTAFGWAIEADPEFAEAYSQRGIAHYMLEDWHAALADCRKATRLNPIQFGAHAGMGHCYAQLGKLVEAARCYRGALSVNPNMHAVAGALEEIESRIKVPA